MVFPTLVKYGVYCLVWMGAYVMWKAQGWPLEAWHAVLLGVGGILAGQFAYHVAAKQTGRSG